MKQGSVPTLARFSSHLSGPEFFTSNAGGRSAWGFRSPCPRLLVPQQRDPPSLVGAEHKSWLLGVGRGV